MAVKIPPIKIPALPMPVVISSGVYVLATAGVKLALGVSWFNLLQYILGAVIGMLLPEILTMVTQTEGQTNPFSGLLPHLVLLAVSVFALTSSSAYIGRGVVLLVNLRFILTIRSEFNRGNWNSWFNSQPPASARTAQLYMWGSFITMLVFTYLFIRI